MQSRDVLDAMSDTFDDILAEEPDEGSTRTEDFGTPSDLVFDDEPVESLLYGEDIGCGPSRASIFAPALEAWKSILQALADHTPEDVLRIAAALLRDQPDIPAQMRKDLGPVFSLLGTVGANNDPALPVSQETARTHMRFLIDLGLHDFVNGNSDRGSRIWNIVAGMCDSKAEGVLGACAPEIAVWWWKKTPASFPRTAELLGDLGWGTPRSEPDPPAFFLFETAAMQGLRQVAERYLEEDPDWESQQLFALCVTAAVINEAAGPENPVVASCLNLLVSILQGEWEYDAAIVLSRQALAIKEKAFGVEHTSTLTQLDSLAALLCFNSDHESAAPLYRRTLEIRRRILGPKHPATLQNASDLAEALDGSDRHEESVPLREESSTILEAFSVAEKPETLTEWNNRSYEFRKRGWARLCAIIDHKSVQTTMDMLGESHPLTIHRRNNLVLSLLMIGRLDVARECLDVNWQTESPPFANTKPRVCFLQVVLALLEGKPPGLPLARLKRLLGGEALPEFSGVTVPWDVDYFLKALRSRLPANSIDFVNALAGAIRNSLEESGDQIKMLDRFPLWREAGSAPHVESGSLGETVENISRPEETEFSHFSFGTVRSVTGNRLLLLEGPDENDLWVEREYLATIDTEFGNVAELGDLECGDHVAVGYTDEEESRTILVLIREEE
jgi:hypothetical protein